MEGHRKIKLKQVTGIMLTLLLISMVSVAFYISLVKADETIYIRSDGTVDPPTAPIQRDGDIYTFTDNINETIEVQRDNIVIDGNGYTLQNGFLDDGFYLNDVSGVTIKNTNIMGFSDGIDIVRSRDNTISRNNITENYNGIHVRFFSGGNTIKDNNIINNTNVGITIYGDSIENVIYHNNFIDNYEQANTEDPGDGTFDNGTEGNYWSDYTGIDSEGDGIGDTPYMIEEGNQDRYPLMNPWIPVEEVPEEVPPPVEEVPPPPFWMEWWFLTIIAVVVIGIVATLFLRRRRAASIR